MRFINRSFLPLIVAVCALWQTSFGQRIANTAEDSLNNTDRLSSSTTIGGYGNAFYQHNADQHAAVMDLERVVLFVGHRFTSDISFFSELEVEDAKVSGEGEGGEIAFEQAYLKFSLDQDHYFTAGLFLPRIGILNENHLPTTFNGNERTQVETYILPSTWRELGIGFYGRAYPVNYNVAVVNGLNSGAFEHGSGIREGRFEGRNATANNLAITGALQFAQNNLIAQVSGYYGGTVGISTQQADSLRLKAGLLGTPVLVGEADVQYEEQGWKARVLGAIVSIPDAFDINRAYGNNTPQTEYGAYAELSYNLFRGNEALRPKELDLFLRYERLDINASVPSNGVGEGILDQSHIVTGLSYLPIQNVVVKADVRFMTWSGSGTATGETNNTFVNLGVGFSY